MENCEKSAFNYAYEKNNLSIFIVKKINYFLRLYHKAQILTFCPSILHKNLWFSPGRRLVLEADAPVVPACDDRPLISCIQEVSPPVRGGTSAVHRRGGRQSHCCGL